jgi:hypothetical protein
MPGYLGCVYSWDYPDNPQKVHELVYSTIKKEASPTEYQDIIAYNYANQVFTKNYKAFGEQLPYYYVKVGYNAAVYLFYKLGFSGPHALFIVNFLSYFFSGVLVLYILKLLLPRKNWLQALIALVIMWLPPVRSMAQNPTPDIFVLVFTLLFLICILQRSSEILKFICLLCCILIRPDYILFALSYLFAMSVLHFIKNSKKINWHYILQTVIFVGIYFFIIKFYHYPGWKDLFYDSFFYRRPVISAESADFTFKRYWDFLIFKLINFKRITLAATILLAATFYLSKNLETRILALLFFANIYIKYVFFPDGANLRFFIGFVILLFFVFLKALTDKYGFGRLQKIP